MLHLVIDGYNVIRQSPELERYESQSLEAGRRALTDRLKLYRRYKSHAVTVVFDGVNELGEAAGFYKEGGIRIGFSAAPEKADDVIKRLARELKSRGIVVSSDRSIADYARSCGCAVIDAPSFGEKLAQAALMESGGGATAAEKPGPRHKRWMTYKKGPAKRLPKKERQHRGKLNKL